MPGVFLNEDEYNFDLALRRFKKQVEKAGILSEMKKRQHFEKRGGSQAPYEKNAQNQHGII